MSTRSTARNLFPPLDNSELTIQRRSRADPNLLNDFEMATEENGDPPVPDLRTTEELFQNSFQFHGLLGDDANKHLDKFLHVTQRIKVNGVTDDALRLYLFPHSLTHHSTAWFDHFLRNSIDTFEQMAKMFLEKYFPPSMVTKLRNEITNFRQRPDESLFEAWERYKLSIVRCPNHNMLPVTQIDTFYNGLTLRHRDTINAAEGGTFMKRRPEECYDLIKNMTAHHNDWDTSAQQSESSSSITSFFDQEIVALKAEMAKINKNFMRVLQINQQVKAVTLAVKLVVVLIPTMIVQPPLAKPITYMLREPIKSWSKPPPAYQEPAYQAPGYQALVHQPLIPQPQVVTTAEFTNYMEENDEYRFIFGFETLPSNTVTNLKEELKGITTQSGTAYQGPTIPTTSSSLPQVVERETEIETPILNSEPVVTPIIEPVVAPTLLTNKDKLYEFARTPLNEHCSAVLKKLQEKLGDPANRTISRPIDLAEDVFVKVGKFHFSADFVVVDFDADPRVPLILGRSFLKIGKAFIDVFKGELTLRVGKEAITFNLDQTSRYPANYNDMTANRSDVIDMDCEEYSQEVLGFSDVITIDAFLALEDDATSPEVDHSYYDSEGDILLLEAFLNDDPSLPPPTQGNYLPQDLPPHLEYAFLEGDDKLPVIIAKDLSEEEKTALIRVLKSHKKAIAWKLSDIKGIDLEFCTHKILMKDNFKPAVQHQRRVNPKIHDVLKKEDRIMLNLSKISQKPNNINTRSEIRRKPGSDSSVFKNKSYIEAQIYQESKSRDHSCLLIKVIFKLNAKIKSPGTKCVILPKISQGTKVAKSPKFNQKRDV
uniref:Reverse transcriptase domain-containing protein n=1 Tax=Tanacetum cinerariifolium TaxID=118510 RepID=A0A699IE49_TANCI|nr:reverse transcriptase domain-containing protein [Tanacetum cinerariifolium]